MFPKINSTGQGVVFRQHLVKEFCLRIPYHSEKQILCHCCSLLNMPSRLGVRWSVLASTPYFIHGRIKVPRKSRSSPGNLIGLEIQFCTLNSYDVEPTHCSTCVPQLQNGHRLRLGKSDLYGSECNRPSSECGNRHR